MTAPLPLPVRILVNGSSMASVTEWHGPRHEFTYARHLEAALLREGQPASMRITATPSQGVPQALKNWELDGLAWSPDVIVIAYGYYECVHFILPRWLERHVHSYRKRPGPVRTRYRQVLRPFWKSLAQVQKFLDRRLSSTLFSNRPRRFAADLALLIKESRRAGRPLIYVMEMLPPGPPAKNWFPGMGERVVIMNQVVRDVIAKANDPEVRVLELAKIAADTLPPGEEPLPDGFHLCPPLHRAVGESLARDILEWSRSQPHLRAHEVRDRADLD